MQGSDPSEMAPRWRSQFVAALAVLLLLKLGLTAYVSDGWGQWAMLPLLIGGDALGAAGVATVAAMWDRRGWVAVVQGVHGTLAALSTIAAAQIGGHINRAFLGLTMMRVADWSPAMAASTGEYFGPSTWGLVAVCSGLGLGLGLSNRLRSFCCREWGLRRRAALGALVIASVAFVPMAKGGWIGLRLQTHDLEASPWVELTGSYLRPAVRRLLAGSDPGRRRFRFDWSAPEQPDTPLVTPLTRARPRRTNLVLILQESIGRRYVDHPANPMPYLRSKVGHPDAVSLDQHHATWSLTSKALFSLLCSEMPYPTYRPVTFVNPTIPCSSLPETLHDAGWYTAFITPQHLGFDRLMAFLGRRGFDRIWDATTLPGGEGRWQAAWGLEDQVAVDALLKLVAQRKAAAPSQPFFVLYEQVSGHHPFIATEAQERSPAPDRIGNYLRAIRAADDAVKATVEGLRRLGLLEDTLVVIVSDHGEGHGNHEGRNAYEPVVRVPAVIFGPQTRGVGGRVDATTSMIDLAPTLLALLDLPVPCPMQGRDLTQTTERRIALYGGRPPKFQIGIADGRWSFILEDGHKEMLFDTSVDPDETTNLVGEHPGLAKAYRQRIEAWRGHSADQIEDYAVRLASSGCSPPDPSL